MNSEYQANLPRRHRTARVWHWAFRLSTLIGILFLSALLYNVINGSFGYVAIEFARDPDTLAVDGKPLEKLSKDALLRILQENISERSLRTLNQQQAVEQRSRSEIYALVYERVLEPTVESSWSLSDSLLRRDQIESQVREDYPKARLVFKTWLNSSFISTPQSSDPLYAGVRTATLGTLWTILITIITAFPVGVGAAIYLEEYAGEHWFNRFIQTNITNLAGVPSIIYGMLGLAIFVRVLEPVTSGAAFGAVEAGATANGRTILSAGLTLGLLVLPLIIINAQEAIRAVPSSLRQASFGLGATKWQTIWHHVLPNAIPGILTGTILAVSRAMGETAPLVVVGASSFITFDPENIFSKFTTLPIQIYQWTSRPQAEFRNIAAAAILVLLALLLTLNATAILLRNRYSRRNT